LEIYEEMGWTGLIWLRIGTDNGPPASKKCWEVLEWMHNWLSLEKGLAPCSRLVILSPVECYTLNPYQSLFFIAQIIIAEEHNIYSSLAAQNFAVETKLVLIKWRPVIV
jgi:membrane glycosyltransferase